MRIGGGTGHSASASADWKIKMSDLADLVALNRLIVCVEIGHLQQNFTEANGFSEVNAILCTGDAGLLPTNCVVQDLYSEQRSDSSH
jgi:hypothetical protein